MRMYRTINMTLVECFTSIGYLNLSMSQNKINKTKSFKIIFRYRPKFLRRKMSDCL